MIKNIAAALAIGFLIVLCVHFFFAAIDKQQQINEAWGSDYCRAFPERCDQKAPQP